MNKHIRALPLLLLLVAGGAGQTQQTVADRIVAVVGKEALLQSDLAAQVQFYVFNNHVDAGTPGLQQQVLNQMIDEKLIISRALEDTNISVTDDEVNAELEAVIQQRVQQAGSEKRLEEIYGMPISRMRREFRDEMRKQLYSRKLQQEKFGDVAASRREVEQFFAQYKDSLPRVSEELELYHIFKIPGRGGKALLQVKEKALNVLDSLRHGGDFADFARRYSEDKGSAPGGGDLNFVRRGEFVKEFEEVVFGLKEGQISDPVETPFGIHLIQLLERRGESVHARHILFRIPEDSTAINETILILNNLRDSVKNGASFYDLAKRYSDDKETGPVGGYIGRYPVTQLDASLLDIVKDMKEGDISAPAPVAQGSIKGYHIVYLRRRIPEHAINLTDDWSRIEQLAMNYKRGQQYQEWIKQLRNEIYWDIRL